MVYPVRTCGSPESGCREGAGKADVLGIPGTTERGHVPLEGRPGEHAAAGAAWQRWRRAGLTGTSAIAAQVVVMIVGLVSTPLAVEYLGKERYGIWLTLSSMLAWLAISDVGLGGNALVNAIAEAEGRDDRAWQRELVATAFWSLAGIGAFLGLGVWAALGHVPWRAVFKASAAVPSGELVTAVAACVALFALGFPARVASTVYYGAQQGYVSNVWNILSNCASLGVLFLVTRRSGGLLQVVLALWGTRVLFSYLVCASLFGRDRPWLLPVPWAATRRALRRLTSLGVRYVVAQVGGFAMFQSQPIVIAQLLGPAQVAVFGVAHRLATFPAVLLGGLLNGLMPAYGEARGGGDWEWIRRTFRGSLAASALLSLGAAGLIVALLRPAVRLWVGPALDPPLGLEWALAAYVFLGGIVSPVSVMLYGLERVGKQALIAVANGVLVIVLGLLFTPRYGLTGMAAAMACAIAFTNLPGQFLEASRTLRERSSRARGATGAGG